MKLVINRCWGGFSISEECAEYMASRGHKQAQLELEKSAEQGDWYGYGYRDGVDGYDRTDPLLVEAVENLNDKANGRYANLVIVEIPDGIDYYIDDYDGQESIHEKHRSW
jgi:hypothetical protein